MGKDYRVTGQIALAIGLIGLGILFLVGQLLGISLIGWLWPFFVITPGVLFFVVMALGGKDASGFAIPGSIITTVGLILFYQNLTGHWASWAYAWALIFPTAVGAGMMIHGAWGHHEQAWDSGKRMATTGLIIYVVAAVFFELILNISGSALNRIALPVLLIGLGLYLLFGRAGLTRLFSNKKEE